MTKIIKENGNYKIEFAKDSFGPYEFVFSRTDCYYNDKIRDRGSALFPYKNKEFNNTEIFLETDDIIVCTGDRTNLSGEEKNFIDVINIKTEKKQRLYVEEVNLIYNGEKEIVVNGKINGVWKTVKLVNESLEIKEEKEEKLFAFFKVVCNENEKKWYRLDWDGVNYKLIYIINDNFYPINFERELYKLGISSYYNGEIETLDLWKLSCEKIVIDNKNFVNNQNYAIDEKLRKEIIFHKYKPLSTIIKGFIFFYIFILIFTDLVFNGGFFIYNIDNILLLYFFIIFFFSIFITNIIYLFKDLKDAKVFKKRISKGFDILDFEILRNKNEISSKKQKIMIK